MNDLTNKVIKVMKQYLDERTNDIEEMTDDEIFEYVYDTMEDRRIEIEDAIVTKTVEIRATHIELIVDDLIEEVIDDWLCDLPWTI